MNQNNSNTSSEKEISENPLRLISLSNGVIVLGRVTAINQHVVQLSFPVSMSVIFDKEGDIVGTSALPYLAPFSALSPFSSANFNINQVVSFSEPSPELAEQYEESLRQVTERFNEKLDRVLNESTHLEENHDTSDAKQWKAPSSKTIH